MSSMSEERLEVLLMFLYDYMDEVSLPVSLFHAF